MAYGGYMMLTITGVDDKDFARRGMSLRVRIKSFYS